MTAHVLARYRSKVVSAVQNRDTAGGLAGTAALSIGTQPPSSVKAVAPDGGVLTHRAMSNGNGAVDALGVEQVFRSLEGMVPTPAEAHDLEIMSDEEVEALLLDQLLK
jgi:hypothetical protein